MSGLSKTATNDVAIYSPATSAFYEDLSTGDSKGPHGGGAELQMLLLADGLARRGLQVVNIVWPVHRRRRLDPPAPGLVERPPHAGLGVGGRFEEARHIWNAMRQADARVYVFRGGGPQVLVAATFCRRHRRKLVFSSAIDLDFDFSRPDRERSHLVLARAGARRADAVVVQTQRQATLAAAVDLGPVTMIPSFAEPAESSTVEPEGFIWIGRLVTYKRPLDYLDLARTLPNARFRMVFFERAETPADTALATQLREEANGVANLELIDQLPRAGMLDRIARATALVSTSAAEGMPNVFLEAWARGVPVISLEYDPDGAIAELGLGLTAGGSADALADATRSVAEDRALRDRLGRAGRDFVRERHSLEAVSERWAKLVRCLIA